MARYSVTVIDQTVQRYREDGEGDYVSSKSGFVMGTYPTLDAAKQGINDYFGYEPYRIEGEYIMANLIEDANANADPRGDYLVDYLLCIDRIERVSFVESAWRSISSGRPPSGHPGRLPFDRGGADFWYGSGFNPHYYKGATYSTGRVELADMTPEEITAYTVGYREAEERGEYIMVLGG